MWLPPGGHIEPNEIPDDAAEREVFEETGVRCVLVGERALEIEYPRQLVRPEGIQIERIGPGHEHIDLIYFARPANLTPESIAPSLECLEAGWYGLDEMAAMGVNDEIRAWSALAVARMQARGLPRDLSC